MTKYKMTTIDIQNKLQEYLKSIGSTDSLDSLPEIDLKLKRLMNKSLIKETDKLDGKTYIITLKGTRVYL